MFCGNKYSLNQNLYKHTALNHTGVRPFSASFVASGKCEEKPEGEYSAAPCSRDQREVVFTVWEGNGKEIISFFGVGRKWEGTNNYVSMGRKWEGNNEIGWHGREMGRTS